MVLRDHVKWVLVISLGLLSTGISMFISAYNVVERDIATYYSVKKSKISLMSNLFNIVYLLLAPLLFPLIKKKYMCFVHFSIVFVFVGSIGRYLCKDAYVAAMVWTTLVAIANVIIVTAPFGLMPLFDPAKRGYAMAIAIFLPLVGHNVTAMYAFGHISSDIMMVAELN
jgi:hypothetical protein